MAGKVLDRLPRPALIEPFDVPPPVRAALDAFARALDPADPMVAAFAVSSAGMAVCDPTLPDNPVVHVNPAFEELTGYPASEVVGRNCRFMQGPLTDAADTARLREALRRRERITIDLLNHRRDGTPFWNRLTIAPVFDDTGGLRYFVSAQLDVTIERYRLSKLQQDRAALEAEVAEREAALAEREARLALALKAGGLGTWTLEVASNNLVVSERCVENYGFPADTAFTFETLMRSLHPDDVGRLKDALHDTLTNDAPLDIEYRILNPGGEQRWIHVQGALRRGARGEPLALSGFSANVSARKFAEEHRLVLARELTHRVKNTLATVGAVVSQTLRDASSLADARTAVAGRIASLGAAHELLVRDEIEGAAIGDIVDRVLEPFADRNGRRFSASGPVIRLTPDITLALSMALHELATNAIKYGALSVPDGQVAIEWALRGDDGARRFTFSWIERDGPPVTPPTRTGFGTRMIERVLAGHVRGAATITYPAEGARFEIDAPL